MKKNFQRIGKGRVPLRWEKWLSIFKAAKNLLFYFVFVYTIQEVPLSCFHNHRIDHERLLVQHDNMKEEEEKKSGTIRTLSEQIADLNSRLFKKNEAIDEVNNIFH